MDNLTQKIPFRDNWNVGGWILIWIGIILESIILNIFSYFQYNFVCQYNSMTSYNKTCIIKRILK